MRSRALAPLSFAFCVVLACALSSHSGGSSLSLVPNGSFEALDDDGAPRAWTLEPGSQAPGRASLAADPDQRQHGRRALRLEAVGGSEARVVSRRFEVEGGKPYLLSFIYRSEGMGDTHRFEGAAARIEVIWSGSTGVLDRERIRPSYRNLPWERFLHVASAPDRATSATLAIALSARAGSPPARIWLDDLRLRPWVTRPASEAPERIWNAAEEAVRVGRTDFRPVADDAASRGRSVLANPAFHPPNHTMFRAVEVDELPPGAYRAEFRIKADPRRDGEKDGEKIATADVFLGDSQLTMHVAGREIRASDFPVPGRYRSFALSFIRPPEERVTMRVRWLGTSPLWVDGVTVRREHLENERAFSDVLAP